MEPKKQAILTGCALLFSLAIPTLGYVYLGSLVAFLFLLGYLGEFLLWMLIPAKTPYASLRIPHWSTLLAFLFLHKVEEIVANCFEVLSNKITGVPIPEITPLLILSLLVLPIGAWLAVPFLIKRGYDVGYYLAWTFFASMGIYLGSSRRLHSDRPIPDRTPLHDRAVAALGIYGCPSRASASIGAMTRTCIGEASSRAVSTGC